MSIYRKPQKPLEKSGQYIYPLTTYDQVILENGERWDGKLGVPVEFAPTLTSGNEIGTLTIDGQETKLYYQGSSVSLNGESTQSASFYAPTSAGNAGQILVSNGNGEPSWGDGDWIPKTGGIITGDILRRVTEADVLQSNNGVTANLYPTIFYMVDNNYNTISKIESSIESSGSLNSRWHVRNYNTDGSISAQTGILLTVTKNGWTQCRVEGDTLVQGNLTAKNMISIQSSSYPQLQIGNASGQALALLYGNLVDDTYYGTVLRVNSSESEHVNFQFEKNGDFYAPGQIYSNNQLVLNADNYTTYTVTKAGGGATGTWGISISGNANTASKLATARNFSIADNDGTNVGPAKSFDGSANTIINLPSTIKASLSGNAATATKATQDGNGNVITSTYLPLSGGTLTGPLTISNGQDLYLKAATGTDAGDIVFVKPDGSEYIRLWSQTGTNLLIRFGASDSAKNIIHSGNYTDYTVTKTGSGASGTWGISITGSSASCTGNAATATTASSSNWLNTNSALTYGASGLNYFNASLGTTASASSNYAPTADWYHIIRMNHANVQGYYVDLAACFHSDNLYIKRVAGGTNHGYKHVWVEGNSVTSAVWNDYAEYRESDCAEFGRVLAENGDDTLSTTTERLQHFAGISSDTWGFCQGETERAKTPIAVAGRVLAYPYRDRDEYKPGDCVCAAPNGTVDIMTREEVERYPDRIVGTVSCVPEYEEWGQGDRPAVKVDGRIWVKVK